MNLQLSKPIIISMSIADKNFERMRSHVCLTGGTIPILRCLQIIVWQLVFARRRERSSLSNMGHIRIDDLLYLA